MRITTLWIKRNLRNRFAYWLYERWCNEPFVPNGSVSATVTIGNQNPKSPFDLRNNRIKISFKPNRFVAGVHEWYLSNILVDKSNPHPLNEIAILPKPTYKTITLTKHQHQMFSDIVKGQINFNSDKVSGLLVDLFADNHKTVKELLILLMPQIRNTIKFKFEDEI